MVFGRTYFEKKFLREDPWGYAASPYERLKHARQVDAMKRYSPRPDDILEIGCAEGLHTAMIARAFPGSRITAVDISSLAISRALNNCQPYENVRFVAGDIIELLRNRRLPRRGYDIIVQSESLYYLFPRLLWRMGLISYLGNLAAMLKERGILVTANGMISSTSAMLRIYSLMLKRWCRTESTGIYFDWCERKGKLVRYEVKVFRRL